MLSATIKKYIFIVLKFVFYVMHILTFFFCNVYRSAPASPTHGGMSAMSVSGLATPDCCLSREGSPSKNSTNSFHLNILN